MKLFARMTTTDLADKLYQGNYEDLVWRTAFARLVKSLDGFGLRSHSTRYGDIDTEKVSSQLVKKLTSQRSSHALIDDRGDHSVMVYCPSGIAHVTWHNESSVIRRVKGRKVMRQRVTSKRSGSITVVLFGLASWVDRIDSEAKSITDTYRIQRLSRDKTEQRKLHILNHTRYGMRLKTIAAFDDVLIRDNYTPRAVAQFDNVVDQFSKKEPSGRLVVIHGPAGTGKTYMVRGLIEACRNIRFVLVPSQMVPSMTAPGLAELLLRQRKPTCLVIEDADMLLVERMGDNMLSISTMLNLADGMFGTIADVRILCTTNAARLKLDSAMMRPGRLLEDIDVPMLPPQQAMSVYTRLAGGRSKSYEAQVTLAKIYEEARLLQ